MRILLEAPILTESGYGVHSRLIYDSLKDKGYQIYTSVLNWGNTSWDTGYLEENPDLKESILRYGQTTISLNLTYKFELESQMNLRRRLNILF
jgi:hypothetical protein